MENGRVLENVGDEASVHSTIDGTNGINNMYSVSKEYAVKVRGAINGTNAVNGTNGTNGTSATNGTNGINGTNGLNGTNGVNGTRTVSQDDTVNGNGNVESPHLRQTPIAVVGFGCRLPGNSNSPKALWEFLSRGGVADNEPPSDRYNYSTHYDGSQRPGTMPSPGGMLLKDVDLAAFDASFFNTSHNDATIMDPQQRQLLEVTYECLENSGVLLDKIRGTKVGCVVANNACEYEGFALRDHEDQINGRSTGFARSILSNRISHFLDVTGPSISIDTACSGTMVAIDMACRYLQFNQADGMLVAGALLYLDPSALQDKGPMKGAFSITGKCHTFDASADGYMRGEAINAVYLKRLDDAIRDGDPIRAVIRGSATNSDGRTSSLTQPSSEAQAIAIRMAYQNAGITDFNETGYLECHGTGTPTGDPIEVAGLASVFAPTRAADKPLVIGSIKSNVGHSECAAGLSGLIKTVMAVESGIIPGNPTFITPNPRIDFEKSRVRPTRRTIRWPKTASGLRRASVNSFGFGGANAHVVLESTDSLIKDPKYRKGFVFSNHGSNLYGIGEEDFSARPHLLVFSANDKEALQKNIQTMSDYLVDPAVHANLSDVAYTLSERRTHHFHRGFVISKSVEFTPDSQITGKQRAEPPRVAFIFTGQGAQWSQMGKDLIESFPLARAVIKLLDAALQSLSSPPQWSLLAELTEKRASEALRLPEFSQPLVTALQIALLAVLRSWGIRAARVIGHSSGEIAAAVAAELLTPEEAIKIAYFRGQAAKSHRPDKPLSMLAVGVSSDVVKTYLETEPAVYIACYNSPVSLTLSGQVPALERLRDRLQQDGHFARLLQVDLAYHSKHISDIADNYHRLLQEHKIAPTLKGSDQVTMFSSVTGLSIAAGETTLGPDYWRQNMVSAVQFSQSAADMLSGKDNSEFLIEIGPTSALAGPVAQVIKATPGARNAQYTSAAKRGTDTILALYETAGKLWANAGVVDLSKVNAYDQPSLVVDLPNYQWNHSRRYWHESISTNDYRQRPFISHDLLGSKILSVPWQAPTFYKVIELSDLPWLRDHEIGGKVIFPGAGYLAMAVEAAHQTAFMNQWKDRGQPPAAFAYRLKDVQFLRGLVLNEDERTRVTLAMTPVHASPRRWYNFRIRSWVEGSWIEHCTGLVRVDEDEFDITAPAGSLEPLHHPDPGSVCYKNMNSGEYNYGPCFQRIAWYEWAWGSRRTRGLLSMEEPPSAYSKQSQYPVHPVCIDSFIQLSGFPIGQMQLVNDTNFIPAAIESVVIPARSRTPSKECMLIAEAKDVGSTQKRGSRFSSSSLYDPADGTLVMQMNGLRADPISSRQDPSEHVYMHFAWDADVSLTSAEGLNAHLIATSQDEDKSTPSTSARVQKLLNLFSHQKADIEVLEVSLDDKDATCLWLDEADKSLAGKRNGYSRYHCISKGAAAMSQIQNTHSDAPRTTWELLDVTHASGVISSPDKFDLAILKSTALETGYKTRVALSNVLAALSKQGKLIFLQPQGGVGTFEHTRQLLEEVGYFHIKDLSPSLGDGSVIAEVPGEGAPLDKIACIRFTESEAPTAVLDSLKDKGWTIESHSNAEDLTPNSNVLVVDELFQTVTSSITSQQWDMLQAIVQKECNILWVSKGGQMAVTDPDRAAAPGLLRTIRSEELGLRLIALDVQESTGPQTVHAINQCLQLLKNSETGARKDSEFAERGGVIHTPRVVADQALNEAKFEPIRGREPQVEDLSEKKTPVCLGVERIGTIESLQYAELSSSPLPVREGFIEVEVFAAGVNFKDLAVTLGIVASADTSMLGSEAAGIITRVGNGVEKFSLGQRVALMFPGSFANRIQVPWQVAHAIPDSLSFEEAATLPVAYLTALHGLFDLGNLQRGQRVLVHSATGGIFATVGTDEKSQFLQDSFGIPADHIFSSRNTDFEHKIMKLTNGLGVDVILNSLTGDLFEASWNIVAYGGTMVEIGKKDIMEHNRLSLEPFSRCASFRALDLSRDLANLHEKGSVLAQTLARLLDQLFELLEAGHIRPIFPVQTFAFDAVADAFVFMRKAQHIGKLVLSRNPDIPVRIPIRPAPRTLHFRSDAAYLLVGGLKGICGSLAVSFAKKGAKHLATVSRSSYDDEQSQAVLRQLHHLGCHIDLLRGDVTKVEDVRRIFRETAVPVGGVIQGAMVLRDRPFAKMTIQEYREATACKIQGTWNLHNVALENNLQLDFFTLLSSISSVLGNPAQGNYASACSFQDAFASYRNGLGLPACTINLGIIEQIGYMARNDDLLQRNVSSDVARGINEKLLCEIIDYSILQQSGEPVSSDPQSRTRMVTGLTMPQPADSMLRLDARFSSLFSRDAYDAQTGGDGTTSKDSSQEVKELNLMLRSKTAKSANMPQLVDATVSVVGNYLSRAMRLSEPIEPERSLSNYGIDSLAAVEFRNWVRLELGAMLSVLDITTAPSLISLSERIISKVDSA
ncbi:hypothetical protein F5B20DRAFT_586947 [Whalleya microplaca]|nr:hypothetical protein F5B20DRAFT_586947 [Whalleya microplaca]